MCTDKLIAIVSALVAAVEMAMRESAGDTVLMFFVDEESASRFLAERSKMDVIWRHYTTGCRRSTSRMAVSCPSGPTYLARF